MAIQFSNRPKHGTKVYGAPKEWNRPAIPRAVAVELAIRQGGKDPKTGDRLDPMGGGVEIDHDPPLWMRDFDCEKRDTIPPANSVDHMTMFNKATHRKKTAKGDVPAIAKVKRSIGETKTKPKRKISNRNTLKKESRNDERK